MKDSVQDAFVDFSAKFEGVVRWFYLDIKGLVTIAIGNLVDDRKTGRPPASALALPLFRQDGERATEDEIAAEWLFVKKHRTAAKKGHKVLENVTNLRLTDDGVYSVVGAKLAQMERVLIDRFPAFESWPADAQLGTLSMAWACGPQFEFPKLVAALRASDFTTAVAECKIKEDGNPGIVPRNAANRRLYSNAAKVERDGLDPDTLYWPNAT